MSYKFVYEIVYQNHGNEKESFTVNVTKDDYDEFYNADDFDSSDVYNAATGFNLKYTDFDDMECSIDYPDDKTILFTVYAFSC